MSIAPAACTASVWTTTCGFFAFAIRDDLGDRLDRADLVVRGHDADDRRLGPDRRFQRREVDHAIAIHRQVGGAEALALELLDRVQHGVVLDRARDDVVARVRAPAGRTPRRGWPRCPTPCRRS